MTLLIEQEEDHKHYTLLDGYFQSPFAMHLPGVVPKESEAAHFQIMLPKKWTWKHNLKPVVVQYAGTGDHVMIKIYFFLKFLLTHVF